MGVPEGQRQKEQGKDCRGCGGAPKKDYLLLCRRRNRFTICWCLEIPNYFKGPGQAGAARAATLVVRSRDKKRRSTYDFNSCGSSSFSSCSSFGSIDNNVSSLKIIIIADGLWGNPLLGGKFNVRALLQEQQGNLGDSTLFASQDGLSTWATLLLLFRCHTQRAGALIQAEMISGATSKVLQEGALLVCSQFRGTGGVCVDWVE